MGQGSGHESGHGGAPTRCVRVRIEGRVQGVGYRAWVERQARDLALAGFVRNRYDGSVEALFAGPAERVAEMIERCRRGPPGSKVASVEVAEDDPGGAPPAGFAVLPTA
jgi:acylphosphatase